MWSTRIAFAIVIMLAYLIESIIGFGGTIVALPVEGMLVGLKLAVPALTVVVFVASVIIVLRDFRHIDRREYLKITIIMAIGLLPGMWLFASIPERPLKLILGVFMIVVGLKGLKETVYDRHLVSRGRRMAVSARPLPPWAGNVLLVAGGIIHGAFASGGPFVVVYATQAIKDKTAFRATLCALWATLNGIMILVYAISGELGGEVLTLSAVSLPFVGIAIVLGNIIHHRVNGETFTIFVYVALVVAGIIMGL